MINTKKITINGKDYSYRFSFKALLELQEITKNEKNKEGISMVELEQKILSGQIQADLFAKIIYVGIKTGENKEKGKCELTYELLIDELDEHGDMSDLAVMLISVFSSDLKQDKKKV